nr:hypothetical protein GCM10025730_33900 [Promicromonospora thailandica]
MLQQAGRAAHEDERHDPEGYDEPPGVYGPAAERVEDGGHAHSWDEAGTEGKAFDAPLYPMHECIGYTGVLVDWSPRYLRSCCDHRTRQ